MALGRSTALAALATTLALAGCLGANDAATDPATPGTTAGAGAGDVAPPDGNVTGSPPPAVEPEPVEVPLAYEGETGTFACYRLVATEGCQGQFSPSASHALDHGGRHLRVAGTVTWETSSPTGHELVVHVVVQNETGWQVEPSVTPLRGPSPLAFDFDLTGATAEGLHLDVSSLLAAGADNPSVVVSVRQPFRLEGVYSYVPRA